MHEMMTDTRREMYVQLLGDERRFDDIYCSLDHMDGPCGVDKWMGVPDVANIAATAYNFAVCVISADLNACYTCLPLCQSDPGIMQPFGVLAIGYLPLRSHFVSVCSSLRYCSHLCFSPSFHFHHLMYAHVLQLRLQPKHPMPPLDPRWRHLHDSYVEFYATFYTERL